MCVSLSLSLSLSLYIYICIYIYVYTYIMPLMEESVAILAQAPWPKARGERPARRARGRNVQAACSLPAAYHVKIVKMRLPLLQAVELHVSVAHPGNCCFGHEVQCSVPTATSIAGCGRAQSAMWLEDP